MPTIPGNELYYVIHILIAVGVVGWLSYKSETQHKVVLFIIGLFLLGGSILEITTFKIPGVGFMEIQPDRFVFFFSVGYLIMLIRYPHNRDLIRRRWIIPAYEWAIYAYAGFILIALAFHVSTLGMKEYIFKTTNFMRYVSLYLLLKATADKGMFKGIGQVFVIGSVISSLYAIIQFGVDPFFMRYGEMRIAFGSAVRSNGMFNTEYFHSYFVFIGFAWTLVMIKQPKIKWGLVAIYIPGLAVTFHRMTWLILVVFMGVYLLWFYRARLSLLGISGLVGAILVLGVGMFYFEEINKSQMVQERVNERVDSRFGYYDMVLSNIGEKPIFGYGGKNNDVYYYAMLRITKSLARATGEEGSIHNGYLSNLFYYGIPAFLLFVFMIISALIFYLRLAREHKIYTIPFLFCLVFLIANMTNSFLPPKHTAMMLGIQLGLFGGVLQNRLFPMNKPQLSSEEA